MKFGTRFSMVVDGMQSKSRKDSGNVGSVSDKMPSTEAVFRRLLPQWNCETFRNPIITKCYHNPLERYCTSPSTCPKLKAWVKDYGYPKEVIKAEL